MLEQRLPPPPPDRRHPASESFSRWMTELPRLIRLDSRFARSLVSEMYSRVELTDGAVMLIVRVIEPIMNELCQVFRLRSGDGPGTLKGRKALLERSIQAHQTLGLDDSLVLPLLAPALDANGVISSRQALVESWAIHPDDLGARAMSLLCGLLAERYYAKARKDGRARRAQVVTSRRAASGGNTR